MRTTPLRFSLRVLFCALLCLTAGLRLDVADARTVRLLDFDGTIVDDQSETGTWRTYWILSRIDQMHSMMQLNPVLEGAPQTILISYREYLRHLSRIGSDNRFNSLEPVRLDEDPMLRSRPREFIPGWYQVDDAITFKNYRPSLPGRVRRMLRDYEMAVGRAAILNARGDGRIYDWRGPAFDLWYAGMSDPATVGDTKIFSTRWPGPGEFQELVELWARDGVIRHASGLNFRGERTEAQFYSLTAPEARLLSRDQREIAMRKARRVQDEATALLHGPREPGARQHTLVVAEDDPRNIEAITDKMIELSTSGDFAYDIKFAFLNTSGEEDFRRGRQRFRWSVFEEGMARAATQAEIESWTKPPAAQAARLITDAVAAARRPVGARTDVASRRVIAPNSCDAFVRAPSGGKEQR